jgi:hypothetical protein
LKTVHECETDGDRLLKYVDPEFQIFYYQDVLF